MIDTLTLKNDLIEAEMNETQANLIALALGSVDSNQVATKTDLTETREEIQAFRGETQTSIEAFRGEIRTSIEALQENVNGIHRNINQLKWLIGAFASLVLLTIGSLSYLERLTRMETQVETILNCNPIRPDTPRSTP